MEDQLKKYPIAEIFTSWQGEGFWSGTRMTFIRFAGCNVGKNINGAQGLLNEEVVKHTVNYGPIPIWQEECTSWDGRKFLCDTDFRRSEFITTSEILSRVPKDVDHICLTGGEPLIHDISTLIEYSKEKAFHIETSGTRMFPADLKHKFANPRFDDVWVTVSPKFGCIPEMIARANEIKLLVDDKFDEQKAIDLISLADDDECIVYLSPINNVDTIDKDNMKRCLDILERHPDWKITNQNHKLWGVR